VGFQHKARLSGARSGATIPVQSRYKIFICAENIPENAEFVKSCLTSFSDGGVSECALAGEIFQCIRQYAHPLEKLSNLDMLIGGVVQR
jgi:hypothetical protein